jgi:hypothetical protein
MYNIKSILKKTKTKIKSKKINDIIEDELYEIDKYYY